MFTRTCASYPFSRASDTRRLTGGRVEHLPQEKDHARLPRHDGKEKGPIDGHLDILDPFYRYCNHRACKEDVLDRTRGRYEGAAKRWG